MMEAMLLYSRALFGVEKIENQVNKVSL